MTTPRANVLRTVLQVLVALLIALPTALALVPIPDKYQGDVALALGIAAAAVVLLSVVQNVIESSIGRALFRPPTADATTVVPAPVTDAHPPSPVSRSTPPRGPP